MSQAPVRDTDLSQQPPPYWIGRALIGVLFVTSGVLKIGKFAGIAGAIAGKGFPLPEIVTALTIALEIVGGIALVVGWRTRALALALALFCVPATLLFHAFWSSDATAYGNQLNHFLKNLAIVGALLVVAHVEAHRPRRGPPAST